MKKLISFLIIACVLVSTLTTIPAFAAESQLMQFIDECDDLGNLFSKTSNLKVYNTDTEKMQNDPARIARTTVSADNTLQNFVYEIEGNIKSFEVIVYFNGLDKKSDTRFYVSSDSSSYTEVKTEKTEVENGSWDVVTYFGNDVPESARYLKIELTGTDTARYWDGQVGRVTVSYDPGQGGGLAPFMPDYTDPAPSDVLEKESVSAVRFMCGLGIMPVNSDGDFTPDEIVSKSEFAKYCCKLLGIIPLEDTQSYDYIGMLNELYQMVDISSDKLTMAEAVKMAVDITGHGVRVKEDNMSYLAIAYRLKLLEGIEYVASGDVTREAAAVMLTKAAHCNLMTEIKIGSSSMYKEETDKTLLTEMLKIYNDTGVVFANNITALTDGNTKMARGVVQVGDTVYNEGDTQAASLLGYNTNFYYQIDKGTKERTLVYIEPLAKNNVVELDAKNINSNSKRSVIYYWQDKDGNYSEKKYYISTVADMIYNNKSCSFDIQKVISSDGKVKLIDNNRDGKYDVVFVTQYESYVVDRVAVKENMIYDKYSNSYIEIDSTDSRHEFFVAKDGEIISAGQINEWNVISVEKATDDAGRTYRRIWVIDSPIEGIIDSIETKNNVVDKITIGETVYDVSVKYNDGVKNAKAPKLSVGDSGVFYLDVMGRIAAFKKDEVSEGYAILKGVGFEEGLSTGVEFKLFTQTGEWVTYTVSEYVRLNDKKAYKDTIVDDLKATSVETDSVRQLIKYKTKPDGELKSIYTVQTYNDFVSNPGTESAKERARSEGELSRTANYATARFNGNNMSIYKSSTMTNELSYITGDTLIFSIPDITEGEDYDERYDVVNSSYFVDNASYADVDVYDEDEFNRAGVVVMKSGYATDINVKAPVYVFKHMTKILNEREEETYNLKIFDKGVEKEYIAYADAVVFECGKSGVGTTSVPLSESVLTDGDIIQIMTDTKNNVRVIYRWDSVKSIIADSSYSTYYTNSGMTGQLGFIIGSVEAIDANNKYIKVKTKKTDNSAVFIPLTMNATYNCYIVNCIDGEKTSITMTKLSEILDGDRVFIQTNWVSARNVIVVRKN